MAVFPSFNLTKKGEELLNRSIGEGRVLTFTKFKIGDGVPTGDWRELDNLQSSFKEFPVLETAIQADQVLRIRGYFDNKGFATDKQFKEIGVFVTLDGVAGEHLYSYTNAGDTGDVIPAESRGFYSRTLDVNNYIGYATNITFNIEQARDNYDFNTENELKVATFLKKGDKIRLWGRLVLGDIETLNYIVTDEVTSFILDNGLYCKLAGDNRAFTVENDLINLKGAVVGDVVEVLGFYAKGDGSHHKRIAKAEDDGSGELGQGGIWWCIVHSGEVNVSWFGAKGDGVTDDTVAIQRAVDFRKTGISTNYYSSQFGLCIKVPAGDFLINDLKIKCCGLKMQGVNNKVSRFICNGDKAVTWQPLLGGSPFTNTGFGGSFINDISLYANSDIARNSGVGLKLINCFVTNHTNFYVAGFKKNIELEGCHFNSFFNFYAADEKINPTSTNPNEEIFNRGYAISVSKNASAGEVESSSLKINGGWLHNTSLDLENSGNVQITNIDIEPASQSIVVGGNSLWEHNRFERMDYYAIENKYPLFSWFIVKGDYNNFVKNNIHSLGAWNKPFVNPKFQVEGNYNNFDFKSPCIRYGLIDFKNTTKGNYVEVGKFEDLKYFAETSNDSVYSVENIAGIFEGENDYSLIEDLGQITSAKKELKITGCSSLALQAPANIQGLSVANNLYTVLDETNRRIILNFNTTTFYEKGVYCLKFMLTCDGDFKFKVRTNYTKESGCFINGLKKTKKYICVRFAILESGKTKIEPTLDFSGVQHGHSFTITELELLRFDGGVYVKNIQLPKSQSLDLKTLDTPYYAYKMQQEGIYDDYAIYRDELHRYENSQTTDETMLLPVLQEPVIPESVKAFAEKYKLI